MLYGFHAGELELRKAGGRTRLRGRFPYNRTAVLSDGGRDGGRPRKERIASAAFAYRIERPEERIDLLLGHDYGTPLASRVNGTLDIRDTAEAVEFTATIAPELERVSYVEAALAGIAAGLVTGLSPGFRLPPPRTGVKAETIEHEPDDGNIDSSGQPRRGAIIRTVLAALLYELSVVTIAAYDEAQVELRTWNPDNDTPDTTLRRALQRWRS
jgi:phage head maturation protease